MIHSLEVELVLAGLSLALPSFLTTFFSQKVTTGAFNSICEATQLTDGLDLQTGETVEKRKTKGGHTQRWKKEKWDKERNRIRLLEKR